MPYIGAGIQKFNTADGLTVSGSTELDGAVVVNESSADADFRVESNGNANMLFVDAGNDKVAIGTGTAVGTLTTECTAGDSNFALTAYHPTSTSARNIAKFQSNVGSTQADVVTIGCDGGITTTGALDVTTSTHANASVFKSTGNTQLFLQDTDASSDDQFWGLQVSGGDFNILTCNDDRAGGFSTPFFITQAGLVTIAGTGIAIGGTGSENTLNDYEEGTFTPDIRIGGSASGISHSSQIGQYTKIGRMVTLTGRAALSSKGSGSGAVTIGGMPFASQNTSNLEFIGSVQFDNLPGDTTDNLTTLTNHNIICRVSPNVLTIEIRRTLIGANDLTNVQISDTAVISFTITYFT
jgi:hypothetical protein